MSTSPVIGVVLKLGDDASAETITLGPYSTAEIKEKGLDLRWPEPGVSPPPPPVLIGTGKDFGDLIAKLTPGIDNASIKPEEWPEPFNEMAAYASDVELKLVRAHLNVLPAHNTVSISGTVTTPASFPGYTAGQTITLDSTPTATPQITVKMRSAVKKNATHVFAVADVQNGAEIPPKTKLALATPVTGLEVAAGGRLWTVVALIDKKTDALVKIGAFSVEALILGATNEPDDLSKTS